MTSTPLTGRVALITGGGSGIGRASVLRFLRDGAAVVAADVNASSAASVRDEATAAGWSDRLHVVRADVSSETDVADMVSAAVETFGCLDILFNNAGVGGAFGPLTDVVAEDWDYTFDVLVRGVFFGLKHGAKAMRAHGQGGSIINTASIAGLAAGAGAHAYSAAKAAVINLSRTAAVELAPHRIRVNSICPGYIVTPFVHRGRVEDATQRAMSQQPWPDPGLPDDVAAAAAFLGGEDSKFITGHALVVDGGRTAAGAAANSGPPSTDAGALVGVNKGSTGERAIVRFRSEPDHAEVATPNDQP